MARLYQQIAQELQYEIATGVFQLNERLPSERVLVERFNVSRTIVREALLYLEILGLISIKTGAGATVIAKQAISDLGPDSQNVGPFELLDVRIFVESEAAYLAASRISEIELERLRQILDDMSIENQTQTDDELADREFHLTIARASGNSALESTVAHLWSLRSESPLLLSTRDKARKNGIKPVIWHHEEILKALERKDPRGAYAAMQSHLVWVKSAFLDSTDIDSSAPTPNLNTQKIEPPKSETN